MLRTTPAPSARDASESRSKGPIGLLATASTISELDFHVVRPHCCVILAATSAYGCDALLLAVAVRITVPPHEVLFGERRPERSLAGSRSSDEQCEPAQPSKHVHVPFARDTPAVALQIPFSMQSAEEMFVPTPRMHDPPPTMSPAVLAKEEVSSVKTNIAKTADYVVAPSPLSSGCFVYESYRVGMR